MIRGGEVSFDYEWERLVPGPNEDVEYISLSVTAIISDYHPAVYHLRNGDPGYPAEGGDVDNIVVTLPDGTIFDPLPEDLLEALITQAQEEHDGRV